MKYLYLTSISALALLMAPALWALPIGHGCALASQPPDRFYDDRFDRESLPSFIVSAQAPVYRGKDDNTSYRTLDFGSRVYVVDPADDVRGTRARVANYENINEVYGWVDQEHILCRTEPLRLDNGILRRAFVQTATRVVGNDDGEINYRVKLVYDSSEGACNNHNCREIGKFKWFFTYGERDGKLLVSEDAQLVGYKLDIFGWLNEDDVIEWHTASALRPSEKLEESTPEGYICAYPTPESISDPDQCRQVLGGERWFESNLRLPILDDGGDENNGYWKVVFKGAGNNLGRAELLESVLRNDNYASPTLNNLDVMFVIDGTDSMDNVINAIKGTNGSPGLVERLASRLADRIDANTSNSVYRVGFQIYRDSENNVTDGVSNSESYSLARRNCTSDANGFARAFARVQARDYFDDRNFPENVYGGIMRGISNLHSRDRNCKQHSKLIIVIGDNGYSAELQRDHNQTAYSTGDVIEALYNKDYFSQPPVLLFIQMPARTDIDNVIDYNSSYDDFARQASELSDAWMRNNPQYARLSDDDFADQSDLAQASQFRRLSPDNVSDQVLDQIVEGISGFFNPRLVEEILYTGEAIVDVIERMRRMNEYESVPILWWGMAEEALCHSYAERCTEDILDKVQELYIPKSESEKLVLEVLITDDQFTQWENVLGAFRDLNPGHQTRRQMLEVITNRLNTDLGVNLEDTTDRDRSLGEILQLQAGLPYGFSSAILQYNKNDILSADEGVPGCELAHVRDVALGRLAILRAIRLSSGLPIFSYEPFDERYCTRIGPIGRELRTISRAGGVEIQAFNYSVGKQTRSLFFSTDNDKFYWLPIEWLP